MRTFKVTPAADGGLTIWLGDSAGTNALIDCTLEEGASLIEYLTTFLSQTVGAPQPRMVHADERQLEIKQLHQALGEAHRQRELVIHRHANDLRTIVFELLKQPRA